MDKSDDVANTVVNEQLSRMLEHERGRLEVFILPGFEQDCPSLTREQIFEAALRTVVMAKISVIARSN